jgi:TonB family protein
MIVILACTTTLAFIINMTFVDLTQEKSSINAEEISPLGFNCTNGEPSQARPEIIKRRLGDITRKAIELPQPEYPEEAKAAGIVGTVTAEVVIDLLTGKVVWARIETGHPLLQESVKKVVCKARFLHTNDIPPVRASGMIRYKFGSGTRGPPHNRVNRSARRGLRKVS